ncbi:MAG: hypothetical protein V1728_02145 [Candidatus Micrarchaeota archaeon]
MKGKSHNSHGSSSSGAGGHLPSPSRAAPGPSHAISPPPKPSAFNPTQKYALIGGAIILVLVLGALLLQPQDGGSDPTDFLNYLVQNPQSGIIVDTTHSPSPNITSRIMQCGVNLISSGFYKAQTKDLLFYSCNATGCFASGIVYNETNVTINNINGTFSLADALSNMRGRAYFYIQYGPQGQKIFHPTYGEVDINADSDETCSISLNTG